MGQKGQAIREVATAAQLCATGPPRLLATHSAQLHTLLGLYAMSMNSMDAAEAQLNMALRVRSITQNNNAQYTVTQNQIFTICLLSF